MARWLPALNRFFYSIGLTILEGYGLTETSPVTNVNTAEDFRIGTVGQAGAGDGDPYCRRWGDPHSRSAGHEGLLQQAGGDRRGDRRDGWFATGDIGEIDADGFLKITDRKKDIIVTAGGKNVAPQPIENLTEDARCWSSRRCSWVIGGRYCALLVVPAFDGHCETVGSWIEGIQWASSRGHWPRAPRGHGARCAGGSSSACSTDVASYETPEEGGAARAEEFTVENGFADADARR